MWCNDKFTLYRKSFWCKVLHKILKRLQLIERWTKWIEQEELFYEQFICKLQRAIQWSCWQVAFSLSESLFFLLRSHRWCLHNSSTMRHFIYTAFIFWTKTVQAVTKETNKEQEPYFMTRALTACHKGVRFSNAAVNEKSPFRISAVESKPDSVAQVDEPNFTLNTATWWSICNKCCCRIRSHIYFASHLYYNKADAWWVMPATDGPETNVLISTGVTVIISPRLRQTTWWYWNEFSSGILSTSIAAMASGPAPVCAISFTKKIDIDMFANYGKFLQRLQKNISRSLTPESFSFVPAVIERHG